jgi:DNA repair exonuclease SbcCD ATPase subunit
MSPEILTAIASLLGTLTTYLISRLGYKIRKREIMQKSSLPSYRDKMSKLTAELARASSEVDNTLQEITIVSKMREEAIKELESKLDELSKHEKETQKRIDTLKNVPLPAVEHFLEMTKKSERRSAARDYILFASGVIVSTVVTVILRLVFNI